MATSWDATAFDPHGRDFLADPTPTYARFRAEAPVARVEPYGSYWVFRHADVRRVLDDQQNFVKVGPTPSLPPPPFDALANLQAGIFNADPPAHTRMRTCLEPLLADCIGDAGAIARAAAGRLLRDNRRGRHLELYQDFAVPLPPQVLFAVLGLPEAHWPGVQAWVDAYIAGHDITQPLALQWLAGSSAMALMTYFQAMMDGHPVCPASGRVVQRLMSEGVTQGLTVQQIQGSLQNLAIAGYASTSFLIATGTYRLLSNPGQLALLRRRPELLDGAIAEMLRHDAPAQLVDRVVACDVELGGVRLRAGDTVSAVIGSANHDESVFPDPQRFDIERDTRAALGFGAGIHHCLGAPLVALSAPAAFQALLDACPEMRLAGLVQWQTDPYLRSVVSLPLAVL